MATSAIKECESALRTSVGDAFHSAPAFTGKSGSIFGSRSYGSGQTGDQRHQIYNNPSPRRLCAAF